MAKSVQQLLQERFGTGFNPRTDPEVATVGTTAVVFLRRNPNRAAFVVVNLSSANMFIGPFTDPSSSKGIFLSPNGGNAAFLWEEDFDLTTFEWSIVASAAGAAFTTIELETTG